MPKKKQKKSVDLVNEDEEISSLNKRIESEAPERGYAPPLSQQVAFRALPLSNATLTGLDQAKKSFHTMTAIQNACIPHALAGRDILGAARTGRYVLKEWCRAVYFLLPSTHHSPWLLKWKDVGIPDSSLGMFVSQSISSVGWTWCNRLEPDA